MSYTTLYTRQHINSLNELNSKGYTVNHRQYIRIHMGDLADYFCQKYDYFVKLAEQIVARPDDVDYPIWCSISKANCLKPIDNQVVYQIKVPSELIIYFDSVKWDFVLNDLYIPKDAEDKAKYLAMLKRLGIKDEYSFIRGRYRGKYPDIEQKIRDSWQRIFTIDQWNEFTVQANIWQIKGEWIERIINVGEII